MDESKFVTLDAHNEFAARIDAENQRQNKRLDLIDAKLEQFTDISISVREMAINVNNLAGEIKRQGDRLEAIEQKPAKRWETLVGEVIKYAVAFVLGALIMRFGIAV